MKKVYTFFFAVILTAICLAQAPRKMSYQAVIRDGNSTLVQSHAVGMRIQILQTSEFGAAVYVETHSTTTNVNGLVTLEIGSGNVVLGTFAGINWADGPYFLKTETDPEGGTNYTIKGTSQLLSVPYALYTKTAENGFSGNYNDLSNKPTLFSGSYNDLTSKPTLFNGSWVNITDKPTTIAGYGITDAVTTSGNQTIAGNKTFTGTTTVSAPINATDAANKAYVDNLQSQITALENKLISGGLIVKDVDGNIYNIVIIGTQTWMAENLKTTKYNDGTAIPLVTEGSSHGPHLYTPGYCWYNNDEATYKATYGALYNWYAVNTGKFCPTGWHVSTNAEWTTLTTYLGGEAVAGGKLKETGTAHWTSRQYGATNETGFTALPGGFRVCNGEFFSEGDFGYLWSATEVDTYSSWLRDLQNISREAHRTTYCKKGGLSVRCVRD